MGLLRLQSVKYAPLPFLVAVIRVYKHWTMKHHRSTTKMHALTLRLGQQDQTLSHSNTFAGNWLPPTPVASDAPSRDSGQASAGTFSTAVQGSSLLPKQVRDCNSQPLLIVLLMMIQILLD